ncbi:MAG: hypothetical protein ACXWP4_28765 [Polyangiales bacterium]
MTTLRPPPREGDAEVRNRRGLSIAWIRTRDHDALDALIGRDEFDRRSQRAEGAGEVCLGTDRDRSHLGTTQRRHGRHGGEDGGTRADGDLVGPAQSPVEAIAQHRDRNREPDADEEREGSGLFRVGSRGMQREWCIGEDGSGIHAGGRDEVEEPRLNQAGFARELTELHREGAALRIVRRREQLLIRRAETGLDLLELLLEWLARVLHVAQHTVAPYLEVALGGRLRHRSGGSWAV